MNTITFEHTDITGGFWKQKQDMIRNVTMKNVYERFKDTGRFDAFKCNWTEGMPNKPHIFWDSDVAKWLESAAYLIEKKEDEFLTEIVDDTVDLIVKNQDEHGYFNSYYLVIEPDKRFTSRDCHELYCAGHLLEASIAYYKATGKDKFLNAMKRYMDYIEEVFIINKSADFSTPGHEEIELALVKLYDLTGEERYINMSKYFIDTRGTVPNEIIWQQQSHLPVREQETAEGHAVRAVYLYSAMADLALRCGDEGLFNACKKIFKNIVERRMYITGAIGSSSSGEAFSFDYDLPNIKAYAESCANLGLAFFCRRMQRLEVDPIYGDTIERILYNGFMSSISLDGKSFFYENPLEINPSQLKRINEHYPITQRVEVFNCSCCPPNITRFISSIADFLYTVSDETIYIQQYMQSVSEFEFAGSKVKIEQTTNYPYDGRISIKYSGNNAKLAIRVPSWYSDEGYRYIEAADGDIIKLDFDMKPQFVEADPRVQEDSGRYAVVRGPLVYCMEAVDNGGYLHDIRLGDNFECGYDEALGVHVLYTNAYRRTIPSSNRLYSAKHDSLIEFKAKLIPYFAFANRGETEMLIWTLVK